MTPEEYENAHKKLLRYGEAYDVHPDLHLPPEQVRNSKGAITKRQQEFRNRPKAYYKAQCSFRGLRTTGTIEEMQKSLRFRDKSEDVKIKRELDKIKRQVATEDKRRASGEAESWWNDPARTFAELVRKDGVRALKESLQKEDTLKRSCYVVMECDGLYEAATQFGLSYQLVTAPERYREGSGSGPVLVQIIGQIDAVKKQADKISAEVAKESRDKGKQRLAVEKAEKAAEKAATKAAQDLEKAKRLSERKHLAAWDPTGKWKVECQPLAIFLSGPPKELVMDIYRDDFEIPIPLTNSRIEGEQEEGGGDFSDMEIDGDEYYGAGYAAKNGSGGEDHSTEIPRFGATFHFGVLTGTMRIYPATIKTNDKGVFHIKNNKTFEFAWRGRETGENKILFASDKRTQNMTFANRGMTFKGTFDCPFLNGNLTIKGQKVHPGYGIKGSSEQSWMELLRI